jgi:hypothetical protein
VGRALFAIFKGDFIPKSLSHPSRVISDGDDALRFVAERI